MDLGGIGRRIAYWRNRRDLTQMDFGALMGKSMRWVQDVEGGKRQVDPRISVLEKAAEVLHIPIEVLLSDHASESASECIDAAEVAAIRSVFLRYDVLTGAFTDDAEPSDVGTLRRSVSYAWDAFQATHYSALGRLLPQLIVDTERAARTLAGDDQRQAYSLASMTYQLASETLLKFADVELAWRAAERGVVTAERSADPAVQGAAARRLVGAMLKQGQAVPAVTLSLTVAARLEADLLRGSADSLSALGALYLKAAVAASEAEAADDVASFIGEAERVARQLGRDGNAMWSAFGPTNVQVHRVSTLVRLHAGAAAATAAEQIAPDALGGLPRERRAHFLVDVAQGYTQMGRRDTAARTLLAAERLAPQEVHCRPASCNLVRDLVESAVQAPSWDLRGLAERCGVTA